MKAISIRAPWCMWIFYGKKWRKDIENRSWKTNFRGTILIQASLFSKVDEIRQHSEIAYDIAGKKARKSLTPFPDYEPLLGHVIGKVDIVDCVTASKSRWYCGVGYGFVLANPVLLKPFPAKGAVGMFNVAVEERALKVRR